MRIQAADQSETTPDYLVDRRQIAVRIGKRRIDLNSPRVTLQRSVHILHLLQRVAHVAVGIGKRRLDPAQAASKNISHAYSVK